MVTDMRVTLKTVNTTVRANIKVLVLEHMKDNFYMESTMAKEFLNGKKIISMKDNTKMGVDMDSAGS